MKRITVLMIAALMLACVLPMARAQQATPTEDKPVVTQEDAQLSLQMAELRARLAELMAQQQDLQKQLDAVNQKRQELGRSAAESGEGPSQTGTGIYANYVVREGDTLVSIAEKFYQRRRPEDVARIVEGNRLDDSNALKAGQKLQIPVHPRYFQEVDEPELREVREVRKEVLQAQQGQARAMVEMKRAQVEAEKAQQEALRAQVKAKAKQQKEWAEQIDKRSQSEQMQQWRADVEQWRDSDQMKLWQQEVEKWAQEVAQRYAPDGNDASGPRPMPPMPAMPAMPPMSVPALPAVPEVPDIMARPETPDLPGGDRTINLKLPERVQLVDLVDLVAKHANFSVLYDTDQVTGEVALKLRGELTGSVKVKELYQILQSVLEERGLTMVPQDGNVVVIRSQAHVPASLPTVVAPKLKPLPKQHVNVTVPRVEIAVPATPAKSKESGHVIPCGDFVVQSFPAGSALDVENNVGSVEIEGTQGRDCSVKATTEIRGVDREEAERIASEIVVEVMPTDGQVRVRVEVPEEANQDQGRQISVALHVTVPADAEVRLAQKVGNARLSNLVGQVEAVVDVGSIQTWNLQGSAALRTNVGNIGFAMSKDLSAQVRAQTRVGPISSNVPIEIISASVMQAGGAQNALGSHAAGTLGEGTNKIDLTTNVGSIQIQQKSAPAQGDVF